MTNPSPANHTPANDVRPPVDIRTLQAQIQLLNTNLGLTEAPFGLVRERVLRGDIENIDLKQALFFHYSIFIQDIWKDLERWRDEQKSSGENPIGLLNPVQELRILREPEALLLGDPKLPKLARLPQLILPLGDAYIEQLRAADRVTRREATLALINLLWRVHSFEWEAKHKEGIARTISPYGIDLFEQCYKLLEIERQDAHEAALTDAGLPPDERFRRLHDLNKMVRRGYQLTNIVGEAMTVGLQVWDLFPESDRILVPMFAATHNSAAIETANEYIRAHRSGHGERGIERTLAAVIERTLETKAGTILSTMARSRSLGNTTGDPEVAGCPALGTAAFQGSVRLLDEVKAFIGWD